MREAVHRNRPSARDASAGTVITTGTFDGVHRGHLAVIETLVREAERRRLQSVVITFDPHPLRVVRPEAAPRLLTTGPEKERLLLAAGADRVITLPFTSELAAYPPSQFVEEILIERYGMKELVIGYDHGFGRGRSGDVGALRELGEELGFDVVVVQALTVDDAPISSSRIRRALEDGDVVAAAKGLGRAYAVTGTVVRGAGQGRALGVPTANIALPDPEKLVPRSGIYAVRATARDQTHDGVLHVGPRPTFPGLPPSIEVHILDFDAELYGETVTVAFCDRIRDVLAFDSPDALVRAMREDIDAARRILGSGGGGCKERMG